MREKSNIAMLAIPIHQPYAWFILNGHKDIENRTRKIAGKWESLAIKKSPKKMQTDHKLIRRQQF